MIACKALLCNKLPIEGAEISQFEAYIVLFTFYDDSLTLHNNTITNTFVNQSLIYLTYLLLKCKIYIFLKCYKLFNCGFNIY